MIKNICLSLLILACVASTSACTRYALWNKYFADGMRELNAKHLPEAENLLQLALKQANHRDVNPENKVLTIRCLGLVYLAGNKYDQAEALFTEANAELKALKGQESIELAENLEDLGITLNKKRKFKQAANILDQALQISNKQRISEPERARLYSSLAFARQYSGDLAGAQSCYRSLLNSLSASDKPNKFCLPALKEYHNILLKEKNKIDLVKTEQLIKRMISQTS